MRIGAVSMASPYGSVNSIYPMYPSRAVTGVRGAAAVSRGSDGTAQAAVDGAKDAVRGGRVKKTECQTCKNRKYVDGSNEGDVSFKAPGHIDPGKSAATVMSHEQEHVANARTEGNKKDKELVNASVSLKTSVCPECGRVYVSGGTTHTTMRTTKQIGGSKDSNPANAMKLSKPTNPYVKNQANLNYLMGAGRNMDISA